MTSAAPTLSNLLSKTDIQDHEEILKAANATLKQSKTDNAAQHVRIVALLKLDRYEDALRALEDGGDAVKGSARVEHAYALYKTGKLDEAVRIASGGNGADNRALQHLLAQTSYRLEDFAKAAELYGSLTATIQEATHEENDLRVNRGAVDAQLEWKGQGHLVSKKKPGRDDLEGFETAYNAACASIARGELGQGEVLLRRAQDLCNSSDELTDDEKIAELLPIMVQHVFVLTRLGKLEEAEKLSSKITLTDISDLSTRHIAQVNTLATSPALSNPFLAHRLFNASPNQATSDKPFDYQSFVLRQNGYVLDLLSFKHSGVVTSTASALAQQESPSLAASDTSVSVINAAANVQSATGKVGIKTLLPLLEKRPSDVGLLLTILQLYVSTNNHSSAITLLESFLSRLEQSAEPADQDVRFAPGLVGTLISLYATQSQRAHIRSELAKAASYWTEKYKSSSEGSGNSPASSLLRAAGSELLSGSSSENRETARTIFANLHGGDATDKAALAGLLASDDKSTIDASALPPAERMVANIDVAALEEAGVASLPIPRNVAVKRTADREVRDRKAEQPRKKRKLTAKRTPKDFVEGKQMDPERWLPMKDRSYYRPKGKKKARMGGGGTQGGVVEEKGSGTEAKTIASGGGASGGGGGQKNKKKKGKGNKW